MERNIIIVLICLLAHIAFAQPPQSIRYQAIAANSSGTPLPQNTTIGIQTRILEDSPGGTQVFTQTQTAITEKGGLFSIAIGPISNSVDWSQKNKFLEVKLDLNNDGNYDQIGTSQLLSVPYAYLAKTAQSVNSLSIVENMAALKASTGLANDLVYLRGYYEPGDGGQGYFMWKTDAAFINSGYYATPNDGTIVQVGTDQTGRWIRRYDGYIHAAYFGVLGQWGNYTTQLQKAIDFAELVAAGSVGYFNSTTIFIHSGHFIVDHIVLKDGVSIQGESIEKTNIYAGPNAAYSFLVEIESGLVRSNLSNLHFVGAYAGSGNTIKGAIAINAVTGPFGEGGMCNSTFKNIQINNFNGTGIYLKGSTSGFNPRNRSLVFENVRVSKGDLESTSKYALHIEGTNREFTFNNCQFEGGNWQMPSKGKNVYIRGYAGVTPASMTFLNCTIQNGDNGIYLDYAENITIDNCIFSQLGNGVVADGTISPCYGINIINSRFGDVAGYGAMTPHPSSAYLIANGHCVKSINSMVNVRGNYVFANSICGDCSFVSENNGNIGATLWANSFSTPAIGKTLGVMPAATQNVTTLLCKQHKLVQASTSGQIGTIDSTLNVGETLTVRAASLTVVFNKTLAGSNITYPGALTTLTLNTNEVAKFLKVEVGGTTYFQLVSIVRNNP